MEIYGFGLFNLMFAIVPLLMFAIVFLAVVRSVKDWHRNERSPRLTVEAKVVTKRTAYRRTMSNKTDVYSGARTDYFATFEFESGDRLELPLKGQEYGMLVEGDRGKLTFQGTRYLGFQRM